MAEQAVRLMTVDEFLNWDDGTDTRHELADGVIRAMAPPSGAHSAIVANTVVLLDTALRGRKPCRPLAEAGIRSDNMVMCQADLAVTRLPIAREIQNPVLIVEILSPSTRTHNLGRKLIDYKSLPSVEDIWMLDSERRWAQVWRRVGDG
jgi:Uma2 family endonuclease